LGAVLYLDDGVQLRLEDPVGVVEGRVQARQGQRGDSGKGGSGKATSILPCAVSATSSAAPDVGGNALILSWVGSAHFRLVLPWLARTDLVT
jgi:hypothetical protein